MSTQVSTPGSTAIQADPRWHALVARDRAADGSFFYSVKTTGVYCRPSCGARTPRPENVAFHRTPQDAEQAGFRPCLRCRPDEPSLAHRQAALIAGICRQLDRESDLPTLAELAARAGLGPHHFHRVFKQATGVTPREYLAERRAARVRDALAAGGSVTPAIHDAGYGSSSRFYERSAAVLGMTPSEYRRGGAGARIRFAIAQCTLGSILVARSERGVCAIALGDAPEPLLRDLQDRFPRAELLGADAGFEQLVASVIALVESPGSAAPLPLDLRGTAFQMRVWQALSRIPPGQTATYSEIAQRIGAPSAVRAVAGACAANPVAVVIPCHRVVRTDGGLGGYRWGIERKQALLRREAGV